MNMKQLEITKDKFVLPGEKLGVVEEFQPGEGTYEEDGNVLAAQIGKQHVDTVNHRVEVRSPPTKGLLLPKKGDVVTAQVVDQRKDNAFVKILGIEGHPFFSVAFNGMLHIAQTGRERYDSMEDVARVGDIIKGQIINDWTPRELNVGYRELGVIRAYCSNCGETLRLAAGYLWCPACRNREQRKIADSYEPRMEWKSAT